MTRYRFDTEGSTAPEWDSVGVHFDVSCALDSWIKGYRPTHGSRRRARAEAIGYFRSVIADLAELYGVPESKIRGVYGDAGEFQQMASDAAADW